MCRPPSASRDLNEHLTKDDCSLDEQLKVMNERYVDCKMITFAQSTLPKKGGKAQKMSLRWPVRLDGKGNRNAKDV